MWTGTLSLDGISHDLAGSDSFDVNDLHSYILVLSSTMSTVEISDSHFIGGYSAVDITGGTLKISDSSFESMTVSILVDSAYSVEIRDCSFIFVGELHGPFLGLGSFGAVGVIDVSDSQNASLIDSVFSSYTPGGFVVWSDVQNVFMNGNEFEIDTDGHFTDLYEVNINYWKFNWQWAAVAFQSCDNAEITGNLFIGNDVQPKRPWMYMNANTGTTCLSANKLRGS